MGKSEEAMKGLKLYKERYELIEAISSGGFATIYRATEKGRQEEVAVKIGVIADDPGYAKSIREEARILDELNHRNVVQLHRIPRSDRSDLYYARAIEIPGNPYFFVMEYLVGNTLDAYLQQVKSLSVAEAAAVALEIALALFHMHEKHYAHNDLKLENIVFRQPIVAGMPFQPVLVDFGIATRVNLQIHAGSPYVMSPEQLREAKMMTPPELNAAIDHTKVDVWGLGVVLYRMLGGQLPFTSRTRNSLTQLIVNQRPTSLQQLSPHISADIDQLVIDGCLAKDPHHRLSLMELGRELRRLGEGGVARQSAEEKKKGGWWPFR